MILFYERWRSFIYNYRWSDYVGYIDGWIPKASLLMPIFGYLILFNDESLALIKFNTLANENTFNFGLSANDRLKMIYFAFFFLGVSNFWYRFRKPFQFKLGTNVSQYAKNALDAFTIMDYSNIHGHIQNKGHRTMNGKYYTSEWKGFMEAAINTGKATATHVKHDGDWEKAKQQYGNLLREMLAEWFFWGDTSRKISLSFCLFSSTVGYILLLIPSGNLFIKVLLTII